MIRNLIKPLAKRVFIQLGLTPGASAADVFIHKNIFGSGRTTLIISNEGMNDVMKIVKSVQKFGLFIKGVSETIKNETKEQKGGLVSMFLGTLGTSLLINPLTFKGTSTVGKGKIRATQYF